MDTEPIFTPRAVRFLRALKRNNNRDWFRARRDDYERDVRQPMIALIERLAHDFRGFAPDLLASPSASLYRIYRDTRFSADKSPLKTHIAAVFPTRGLPKHEGAGLYVQVGHDGIWAGGGLYAPPTTNLLLVREHLARHLTRFRRVVESARFRRVAGRLDGERLQRVPRGFPADHPAAEYLKYRQFLAGREFPGALASDTAFYPTLLSLFRAIAPLVQFLNEPLGIRG